MFDLPIVPESRERVRKRSMYQRRDQCLEAIGHEIDKSLGNPWRSLETLDIAAARNAAVIAASAR